MEHRCLQNRRSARKNALIFDRTDYSGRGKDGFTIVERVCWLADKCDKLQESIDALQMSVDALSGQLARK